MSGGYAETRSKVCGGEEGIKIWSLGGLQENLDMHDLKLFPLHSTCVVQLERPLALFRFYFEERHSDTWETGANGESIQVRTEWLAVGVEPVGQPGTEQIQYWITIEALDNSEIGLQARGEFTEATLLETMFIKLRVTSISNSIAYDGSRLQDVSEMFRWEGDLHLKISVTPIFVVNAELEPQIPALSYSLQRARKMVKGQADLFLETHDGGVVLAHKQILTGASAVFRKMFVQGLDRKDSGGIGRLDLPNVSAHTVRLILYWLYTGELRANRNEFGVQKEVAVRFGLDELRELL